jgi:hypothetical protein
MKEAAICWRPLQLQAFLPDPSSRARIFYPPPCAQVTARAHSFPRSKQCENGRLWNSQKPYFRRKFALGPSLSRALGGDDLSICTSFPLRALGGDQHPFVLIGSMCICARFVFQPAMCWPPVPRPAGNPRRRLADLPSDAQRPDRSRPARPAGDAFRPRGSEICIIGRHSISANSVTVHEFRSSAIIEVHPLGETR